MIKKDVYICIWCPVSEMQGRIQTSLISEDAIINFSPLSKRLEGGVDLGSGLLLKNNILKCLRLPSIPQVILLCFTPPFPTNTRTHQLKIPSVRKKSVGCGGTYSELTSRFHSYFITVVLKRLYLIRFYLSQDVWVVKVAL